MDLGYNKSIIHTDFKELNKEYKLKVFGMDLMILSLMRSKKHLKLNLFGFKLNLKRSVNKKLYNIFLNKVVLPNTILIIEQNNCHFETMLGLCKYCSELGYNVDVLTREPAEKIFENFSTKNTLRVYECCEKTFDKIYQKYDFSKYERIIYNSKRIYFKKKETCLDGYDLSEYYDVVRKGKKENIYLQHHIDMYDATPNCTQIVLANPSKREDLEKFIVNCNYFRGFGNSYKNKNEIVNFISIGELSTRRRNSALLIDAVETLHKQGFKNFKITIVGKGQLEDLPKNIKSYFNILGRLDYQSMFDEIEKADFILSLLDPNIEDHKRYMTSGTSGTFQLIYGFRKPCLIHETFANIYGFNNQSSILYKDNDKFGESMRCGITMPNDLYIETQKNINEITEKIELISINNLKKILEEKNSI